MSPSTASNADKATPSQATFINQIHSNETVIITGTKVWDDFDDAFGLRPATTSNAVRKELEESGFTFTLWRYAPSQPNQGNGIGSYDDPEPVDGTSYTMTWENYGTGKDRWTYTIEGTKENPLERHAPNGMPWIYLVQETSTNPDYRIDPQGGKVQSKEPGSSEDGVTTIVMNDLTNTLKVPNKPYAKVWQDEKGKPITEDYLGYQLQVTFELQVAERDAAGKITDKGGRRWPPVFKKG